MFLDDNKGNAVKFTGANQFLKNMNKLVSQNRQDRSKIVEAGAPQMEKQLRLDTPYHEHHYPSNDKLRGKPRNPLHLKDSVTHKPNQYVDGSTDVGFSKQASVIAYWRDLGTYKHEGEHFIENAVQDLDKGKFFDSEANVYRKLLRKKNIDLE